MLTVIYQPKTQNKYYSTYYPVKIKKTKKQSRANLFFKRFSSFLVLKSNSHNFQLSGFVKTAIFATLPFILIFFSWLTIYSQNIAYDYQIYKIKKDIDSLEKETVQLKEQLLGDLSEEEIKKWIEENHFVKVENLSYLSLKDADEGNDNVAFNH
jgi:hypothetical protein